MYMPVYFFHMYILYIIYYIYRCYLDLYRCYAYREAGGKNASYVLQNLTLENDGAGLGKWHFLEECALCHDLLPLFF